MQPQQECGVEVESGRTARLGEALNAKSRSLGYQRALDTSSAGSDLIDGFERGGWMGQGVGRVAML